MRARDLLLLSVKNVRKGRIKTVLCGAAVSVGIFAVSATLGLGMLAKGAVMTEIEKTGISGAAVYAQSAGFSFSEEDTQYLQKKLENAATIMPFSLTQCTARVRGGSVVSALCGATQKLGDVMKLTILYGRSLEERDMSGDTMVAVVDEDLAREMYGRSNILGKTVTVTVESIVLSAKVIGVSASQTEMLGNLTGIDMPNLVYMPLPAVTELLGPEAGNKAMIRCFAENRLEETAQQASALLAQRYPETAFGTENLSGYIDTFASILNVITAFIGVVAAISVLVGGLGVMNSMVAAVENRRSEIGIYMAIGATRRDILLCFLGESILLCLLGGIAGCALSAGLFYAVSRILGMGVNVAPVLLYSLCGAGLCGVVFGLLPARSASRQNPIDAVRDE